MAQMCPLCNKFHTANVDCNGVLRVNVYRAVQNNDVFAKEFIIPMSVNGKLSKFLRDTSCSSSVIVDKSFVDAEQYVPDKSVLMKGIFDSTYTELPVARVCQRSPRFGEDKNIVTEAAVTAFSDSIDCILVTSFSGIAVT